MTIHALIYDNKIVEEKEVHPDALNGCKEGFKWLPIETVYDDKSVTQEKLVETPVVTILKDKVVKTIVIKDKTPEEIDAEKTKEAETVLSRKEIRLLVNEINALRTHVGLPVRTATQVRNAFKGL